MVPVGRLVVLRVTAKRDLLRRGRLPHLAGPARPGDRPRRSGGWIITVRVLALDLPDQRPARDVRPGRGAPAGARCRAGPDAAAGLGGLRAVRAARWWR